MRYSSHPVFGDLIAGLVVMLCSAGVAVANPKINDVLTAYSTAGAPISINILGTSLCEGSPCVAPKVTLGGKSVSLAAYSPTSITATLPQPVTLGDYTLKVVNASGSATLDLVLANLGTHQLSLYDANNTLIGAYTFPALVLITSSGSPFYLYATAAGFVEFTNQPVYLNDTCSGTPYVPTILWVTVENSSPLPQLVPTAVVVGTTAYVPGGAMTSFAGTDSYVSNGTCTSQNGGWYVQQIAQTVDLSSFVPPFTVH